MLANPKVSLRARTDAVRARSGPSFASGWKNTHVKAQVKLGRGRHAMSTSHHATALPVKGKNPKPKGQCCGCPPLVGLHFLSFWPCGPSFPCILALWTFMSLHFGLVGLHFLAFWPCRPSFPCILALWAFISLHFGLVGLHFLSFWACGPSFPCILALWAFISLHFGLVGLHFLAFWPCGPSFPCILALWVFISLHFRIFGVSFWPPPACCPKWAVCPTSL